MNKVAVRRVNEWDGPSMLKIYAPYTHGPEAFESEPPELQEYIRRIDRYTYGLGWILCEIDSAPSGFCFLTEDREAPEDLFSVELQLYVKQDCRRRGVGSALWALIKDIMELGNRRRVTARVLLPNPEAEGFFRAAGFTPVRTERAGAEKRGVPRDVLVLRRELCPADPGAERPTKPYLIENADYEAARERAALLVREPAERRP